MLLINVFYLIVSFGAGSFIASHYAENKSSPDIWEPAEHKRMLRQCMAACGEDRFKKYSANFGSCECK